MSNADQAYHGDEIAIVGMAGRFPGANNLDAFWQNLRDGVESITFFSDQDVLESGVDPALLDNPCYVRAKGILDDIAGFDAALFGYTPREAEIMDPQQRLFLECAWQALEHAGYLSDASTARIGVFAGTTMSSYALNLYLSSEIVERVGPFQIGLGNDKDYLPTRVSYKLNLKGPSVTVQTACSSSLVAVHLACQSLLNGECEIALAGGASITVPHKAGYLYQEGGIASPDGHCRAFDANAQGTVGGNGMGVVVLKPLAAALDDGDSIHAVIKGSAINNDGAMKAGYTAPSVQGQAEVIAEALTVARVEPESIGYIEAHGTGTPVGDPIELTALARVFQGKTGRRQFCGIGSVKSNIGHLDAAAGVAGLIKTALALKHRVLPPSLHFEQPNPNADLANSPFYVVDRLVQWTASDTPRRAGVSSFGIGGTNAHVVLEEAPQIAPSGAARPWHLLTLSAKTGSALDTATSDLLAYLRQHPAANLADIAYTLQVGRKTLPYRRAL
ncbi:MAG TPA: type I polyketide synthase, partial [Herpetosiphonaceae bacterium]